MSNIPTGLASSWLHQNLHRVGQLTGFSNLHHKIWGPSRGETRSSGNATYGAYFDGTDSNPGAGSGIFTETTVNGCSFQCQSRQDSSVGGLAAYGGNTQAYTQKAFSYPSGTGKWVYFCRFNPVSIQGATNTWQSTSAMVSGGCTPNAATSSWLIGAIGSAAAIGSGSNSFYSAQLRNSAGTSMLISTVPFVLGNGWHTGLIFSDGTKAGMSVDGEPVQYFSPYRTPDSAMIVPHIRVIGGAGVVSGLMRISLQVYCWDSPS